MSGIMRRSLVFMLMLILVSTSNVPVTSDMFTDDAVEIYFIFQSMMLRWKQ